jgi:cis-3-alkyl-4-acyloxetan-2-one decarboxylase
MNQFPYGSNYLTLGDHQLHYIDEGGEQNETILMLHGNPTWSYYYRSLIEAFKSTHRVVVPDHLGMGKSSKPQNYSYVLKNHIENILTLIDFLKLKKITLVVHDWGGAIGFGVMKERPELFKRVIVLNTAAFLSQRIPKRIKLCHSKNFGEWLVRKFNLFAWPATFMTTKRKLTSEEKTAYLAPYDNYENRIAVARFVQDIPLTENHPSYSKLKEIDQFLAEVNIPMLIAWGGRDFCFDQVFFEEWVRRFPHAHAYWFKNAGHYILEDIPEVVIDLTKKFLVAHP